MHLTQKNVIAGLYLAQLMFRTQLERAGYAELDVTGQLDFNNALLNNTPNDYQMNLVAEALEVSLASMREHFGALQATRLMAGLFNGPVLRVAIEHVVEDNTVDWDEVGKAIPEVAKRFRIDDLINPILDNPIRSATAYKGAYVLERMRSCINLFLSAGWSEHWSKNAEYEYAQLWVRIFNQPEELARKLNVVGVRMGLDDSENSDAVHNLMRGTDDGAFECFCIRNSLGADAAIAWEERMVEYGHRHYKGATVRSGGYMLSNERNAILASAMVLGYPVYIFEPPTETFDDLITKIPGGIHPEEARLIVSLIHVTARCLYFELCEPNERRNHNWRGMRLTSSYIGTNQELEFEEGSGWMPLIRHKAMRFANRRFDRGDQPSTEYQKESQEFLQKAKLVNSKPIYASRIEYLVEHLLQIIEDEFYITEKFFGNH